VNSFTVGLAREVGEEGIRVNCVSPGPINTGMTAIETLQKTAQTTALKRVGEPHEVASVILFLASSAASYITGTETLVAGGR
jgi:NAD(P)-dependent dehydrogenase (short-subunit alcohol dehydrogenase family)